MYTDLYNYCNLLMKISKTDNYMCDNNETNTLKNKQTYYQLIMTFITNIFEKANNNRLDNYNINNLKTLLSPYLRFDNENHLVNMRNCLCHREYFIEDNQIHFYHEFFNGSIDCFEFLKIIIKVFGPYYKEDSMCIYLLSCLDYKINKIDSPEVIIKNMSQNIDYNVLFITLAKNILISTKKEIDSSKIECDKINMDYIKYTCSYTPKELKLYKSRLTNQLHNMKDITDDYVFKIYEISKKKERAARGKVKNYFEVIEELNSLEENINNRKKYLEKEKKEVQRKIDYINKYNDLYTDNENFLRLLRNSLVHDHFFIEEDLITFYHISDETNEENFNCVISINELNKLLYDLCDVLDNKLIKYYSKTN